MEKYKILWLDDRDPIATWGSYLNSYTHFEFETVPYLKDCEKKLEEGPYHAVIFDANGFEDEETMKSNVDPSKNGLMRLIRKAFEKKYLIYIFSGHIDISKEHDAPMFIESLEVNYGFKNQERIFDKGNGITAFLDKVTKDLRNKYQYYVEHHYLLDFFTNKWIGEENKTTFLDPIMENFALHNIDYARGNHMRNLVEKLLEEVNQRWLDNSAQKGYSHYKKIVEEIKIKKLESSELIVGPLLHMIELSNGESHSAWENNQEIRELFFRSDYATFFLVTKWFHNLMTKYALTEDGIKSENSSAENPKSLGPKTNEKEYETIATLPTYKYGRHTFVKMEIQVPPKFSDCQQVAITGVFPNKNLKNKGYAQCKEGIDNNSDNESNDTTLQKNQFKKSRLGDLPGFEELKNKF